MNLVNLLTVESDSYYWLCSQLTLHSSPGGLTELECTGAQYSNQSEGMCTWCACMYLLRTTMYIASGELLLYAQSIEHV